MPARPAAGGGRWVDVAPERLAGWLDRFTARHGLDVAWGGVPAAAGGAVRLEALDGTVAELTAAPGAPPPADLDQLVADAVASRRLGLLLARKASAAIGIADGDHLEVSKVETSYVQSRTAAGGWSQQRYARRRANQAKAAAGGATAVVARLLLPAVATLSAVVCGGDRRSVEAILADERLAPVARLRSPRFLDVGEPRLAVLRDAVAGARAVRILLHDPPQ